MQLIGAYNLATVYEGNFIYTCRIFPADVTKPDKEIKAIHGIHLNGFTNDSVRIVDFNLSVLNFVPKGLIKIFPNLLCLKIVNCGLKEICGEDLAEFENLERLDISSNQLTTVPKNLFVNTPKLKWISLDNNKIEHISSELFQPIIHNKIQHISFLGNTYNDAIFSPGYSKSVSSVAELMRIIDLRNLKLKSVETFQNHKESNELHQNILTCHQKNIIDNYENLYDTGNFSDFVIIANKQKEFKVHKSIIAAQSEGFAEVFQKDPNANHMHIEDLSLKAVEKFLRYLYTGKLPEDLNSMEIFALASKLKVRKLQSVLEKKVLSQLDEKNALKTFSLAHKYESSELKRAAFNKIKKLFPDRKLPDELAEDFSSVEEIMELKLKMDAVVAKFSKLDI